MTDGRRDRRTEAIAISLTIFLKKGGDSNPLDSFSIIISHY